MVFRKLFAKDHQEVMKFLLKEPEMNIFIIGDIENFGYDQEFQNIWGIVNKGQIRGVLLRYYQTFIPYTDDPEILKKFAPLITLGARIVSGKKEIIDNLKPYLSKQIVEEKTDLFAHLQELNNTVVSNQDITVKVADITDVDRIIKLRSQIAEFSSLPLNRDSIIKKIESGSGRIYYLENENHKIISSAATSAENNQSAMIVGVASLPEYRRRGYATSCVYRLCQDLLTENKNPCLFYDNPEAGKIYRKIGFREMGHWTIIKLA